jgi:hypothetical protein
MSFPTASLFHEDNYDTLSTLLSCFKFLKIINEETSQKLSEFIPSVNPKEKNSTLMKSLEKFLLFIKNKSILHADIAE